MRDRGIRGMRSGLAVALILVSAARAGAQDARRAVSAGPGANERGLYANPYNNPYMNPFLNPAAMAGQPLDGSLTLYYFLAAQQATGGIGSGRMSGVRPGVGGLPEPPRRVAEMPRAAMIPGSAASRWFGRDPVSRRDAAFGRHNRYFGNNGH